ncbi:hypothetical protein BSL78_08431 [Apostichopus japonicus]|uniref:Uncharacterized protein n=1 Tax=Stichopus japonicus TaxID=307972 RepID=A0A2G8L314_STIJA|nr:hypothetical protein BSL78_08431 [Apostichopus japonicus]
MIAKYSTSNRTTDKNAKATTSHSKSVDAKATASPKKRRKRVGRPKTLRKKKESKEKDKAEKVETDEFEMYMNSSAEKKFTFAVTLAEINRKLGKEWNGPRGNVVKETTESTPSR